MADAKKAREAEGWTTRGGRFTWHHLSGAKIQRDTLGMWVAYAASGDKVGSFTNQLTAFAKALG